MSRASRYGNIAEIDRRIQECENELRFIGAEKPGIIREDDRGGLSDIESEVLEHYRRSLRRLSAVSMTSSELYDAMIANMKYEQSTGLSKNRLSQIYKIAKQAKAP
jgi:hypothetical protein